MTQTKSRGESGHPCLIPEFWEHQLELFILSVALKVGLMYRELIASIICVGMLSLLRAWMSFVCDTLSKAFSQSSSVISNLSPEASLLSMILLIM